MRLQFKHQKFQADAARAVADVFRGQPYLTPSYMMDRGDARDVSMWETEDFTGWSNHPLVPELTPDRILENLEEVQRRGGIRPEGKLEGQYNLTVEMETGVGKTYTYIKTMYELRKRYGWSKYIVVVPSIAIREGVYKTFCVTQEHFAEEYGEKIRFFIYNSKQLTEIDRFASDSAIHVMIINSQAFNAKGKDARRISMELDEFRSRRPIDILAKTNPIVIIDEPQSVEGKQTKEKLKEFHPLFTLRYSATPRERFNLVYRLDAMDAYNKRLVKKIEVKGISASGTSASEGFVYLEELNLSKGAPTANLRMDYRSAGGPVRQRTVTVTDGYNLYAHSAAPGKAPLEEYKNGFTVKRIDGRDSSIEFLNGLKLFAGDVVGAPDELELRRIQIRETILSHLERERQLFHRGIKVLSLFFIDEVAKYRQYDAAGNPVNGIYATMFEEEYEEIVANWQRELGDDAYMRYLSAISPHATHAGYFSVDKKGKMVDSKVGKKEASSEDTDAYDLIMKNKELLLDPDPVRSPVRFLFSHSALKEGWDNPNVFQIATLKQSASDIRKRQEVGRGLRLCVNGDGERQDTAALGSAAESVNVLTVIASESYDSFARGLQTELAEAVTDRPMKVTMELFKDRTLKDASGNEQPVDEELAETIFEDLISAGYIRKGVLTEKYFSDKKENTLAFSPEAAEYKEAIVSVLDAVYNGELMRPQNARKNNVELHLDERKLAMPEFQALWKRINGKSVYVVDFDTEELVRNAVMKLNASLRVPKLFFVVEKGTLESIHSKGSLEMGTDFVREKTAEYDRETAGASRVKYDLVGKLVEETGLTRKTVIEILTGIRRDVFDLFKRNPEEFIGRAARLINEEKATAIIQHITYDVREGRYGTEIFTDSSIRGQLGVNAMKAEKHLYDHIVYDSENERKFAEKLDTSENVAVYVKLPGGFFIETPVGKYNPDWAIAFYEGTVKHIYFVAETKGSLSSMELRDIEKAKIHCAREHFRAISTDKVEYEVVDSYQKLMELVRA